jgi:Flp pilus assembly protein TadG
MTRRKHTRRKGNIVALTAVLMIVMIGFVAMAVDIGYMYTVRNELQRSADAAAIAAAWELIDKDGQAGTNNPTSLSTNARGKATQFAALNKVGNAAPELATNDVNVGYMSDPSSPACSLVATPSGLLPNAVYVRVQRTSTQNGKIPLFFARVFGMEETSETAEATAALNSGFNGFTAPTDGSNLYILPFALDEDTWNNISSCGTDAYSYNPETGAVSAGADGIKECNLFPQGTGCPGNRGTVDIGGSNNSTSDIARQIVSGISASDLAQMGGSLTFDAHGELHLNGDTGISAGVKDELASIIGKPRIIPIFSTVYGPGNNADYTITKFVGVRILDVKLTGSMTSKYLMIQPCNVVSKGGVYTPGATGSQFIYSPVWLVR